jgi:hypothetical protein
MRTSSVPFVLPNVRECHTPKGAAKSECTVDVATACGGPTASNAKQGFDVTVVLGGTAYPFGMQLAYASRESKTTDDT